MSIDVAGIGAVADLAGKVLERIFPDPTERLKAKTALDQLQASGELAKLTAETGLLQGQLDINKVEAASTNWFVAGWRPFCGWLCGLSFAYVAIAEPLARFAAQVWWHYTGPFPVIDSTITMQVLLGMLGLAAARSVEKVRGAEGNR
jgi:hypothetical protein